MIAGLMCVVVGLLSVIVAEVVGIGIMGALPPSVDATGHFVSFVVFPAVAITSVLGGLALTRWLRRSSLGVGLLYPLCFAGGQFGLYTALVGNPMGFRLQCLAITGVLALLAVLWRRRPVSQ